MNWTRLILDALLMAAVFNLAAMAAMAYDPRLILPGYPKSIRESAPPAAREKRLYHKGMIFGMLALPEHLLLWPFLLALVQAGVGWLIG